MRSTMHCSQNNACSHISWAMGQQKGVINTHMTMTNMNCHPEQQQVQQSPGPWGPPTQLLETFTKAGFFVYITVTPF